MLLPFERRIVANWDVFVFLDPVILYCHFATIYCSFIMIFFDRRNLIYEWNIFCTNQNDPSPRVEVETQSWARHPHKNMVWRQVQIHQPLSRHSTLLRRYDHLGPSRKVSWSLLLQLPCLQCRNALLNEEVPGLPDYWPKRQRHHCMTKFS